MQTRLTLRANGHEGLAQRSCTAASLPSSWPPCANRCAPRRDGWQRDEAIRGLYGPWRGALSWGRWELAQEIARGERSLFRQTHPWRAASPWRPRPCRRPEAVASGGASRAGAECEEGGWWKTGRGVGGAVTQADKSYSPRHSLWPTANT